MQKWNYAFSKMLVASAVALSATTSLYAIPRAPCDIKPEIECGCPEPPPGPFAFVFPFDRDLNCPNDVYFYADFLAMQAKQDGMEFAIANSSGTTDGLTNGTVGGFSSDHRDWSYNYGARFGVGFYTDHDAWNIDAVWTWFNIRDYKTFGSGTGGGSLIPLWGSGDGLADASFGPRSSSVWNTNYNLIDVRLGKPYYLSRYVVFNPHFGLRGGWIDQHFSVDYSGAPGPNRFVHHGENDFWGVGLRAGLDTDWRLSQNFGGFGVFGNVAASMLYGKFRIDQNMQIAANPTGSFVVFDRHYMNVPNAEIAMGITWGTFLSQNRYYLNMKAGYEFHVWFDQLCMRKFFFDSPSFANDVVARGNLTLNGFSFRVSLDI